MPISRFLPILTLVTAVTVLFSCSKKEGCNFNEATNFDSEVVIDDGSCTFTKFTFFADTTHYQGRAINDIKITIDRDTIGQFSGMEVEGAACDALSTTSYTAKNVEQFTWTSHIHVVDTVMDTVFVNTGEVRTAADKTCLEVNVLP